MKKITYRKKTGEVVMTGADINNEALTTVEVPDDERINQGYIMKYVNGAIQFTKHPAMIDQEEAERKRIEFFNDVDKLQKAKSLEDIKPILEKLLNK